MGVRLRLRRRFTTGEFKTTGKTTHRSGYSDRPSGGPRFRLVVLVVIDVRNVALSPLLLFSAGSGLVQTFRALP